MMSLAERLKRLRGGLEEGWGGKERFLLPYVLGFRLAWDCEWGPKGDLLHECIFLELAATRLGRRFEEGDVIEASAAKALWNLGHTCQLIVSGSDFGGMYYPLAAAAGDPPNVDWAEVAVNHLLHGESPAETTARFFPDDFHALFNKLAAAQLLKRVPDDITLDVCYCFLRRELRPFREGAYLAEMDCEFAAAAERRINGPLARQVASGTGGGEEISAPAVPPALPAQTMPVDPTLFRLGGWDLTEPGYATYGAERFPLANRNRRLLARLIRGGGRSVHADHLIEAADLAIDRGGIKTYISRLRQHLREHLRDLPADPIPYSDPDGYQLAIL